MKTAALAFVLLIGLTLSAYAYDPTKEPKPADPASAYERGRAQIHKGNWERAAALFRQAVAENPQDHRAYTLLGYSLRHAGRLDEAIAAYDRALALNPAYEEALEYRGIAYVIAGNREAAMRDYRALVRLGSPEAEGLKKAIDGAAGRTN